MFGAATACGNKGDSRGNTAPIQFSREGRDLQPTFPDDRKITNRRQWHNRVRPRGIIRGLCNSQEGRPTLRAREGDHLRENLITSIITNARLAAESGMHFPRSVGEGFFEFDLIISGQVWAGSSAISEGSATPCLSLPNPSPSRRMGQPRKG